MKYLFTWIGLKLWVLEIGILRSSVADLLHLLLLLRLAVVRIILRNFLDNLSVFPVRFFPLLVGSSSSENDVCERPPPDLNIRMRFLVRNPLRCCCGCSTFMSSLNELESLVERCFTFTVVRLRPPLLLSFIIARCRRIISLLLLLSSCVIIVVAAFRVFWFFFNVSVMISLLLLL